MTKVEEIHTAFFEASNNLMANDVKLLGKSGFKIKKKLIKKSIKYPGYKLILGKQVLRICKKYKLAIGKIGNYIGDAPVKNIKEIEYFKNNLIKYQAYPKKQPFLDNFLSNLTGKEEKLLCFKNKKELQSHPDYKLLRNITKEGKLLICAPDKDITNPIIDSDGKTKDPIVLYIPNFYFEIMEDDICVIVTAWGPEAQDGEIFNQQLN